MSESKTMEMDAGVLHALMQARSGVVHGQSAAFALHGEVMRLHEALATLTSERNKYRDLFYAWCSVDAADRDDHKDGLSVEDATQRMNETGNAILFGVQETTK